MYFVCVTVCVCVWKFFKVNYKLAFIQSNWSYGKSGCKLKRGVVSHQDGPSLGVSPVYNPPPPPCPHPPSSPIPPPPPRFCFCIPNAWHWQCLTQVSTVLLPGCALLHEAHISMRLLLSGLCLLNALSLSSVCTVLAWCVETRTAELWCLNRHLKLKGSVPLYFWFWALQSSSSWSQLRWKP